MGRKFFLYIMSLCFCGTLAAQSFIKAKVVTTKGDTVYGEAQINTKKLMQKYEKVILRDANGIQKIFKADKASAYFLENDQFISLDNDGEPRFYRVLALGAVNLYELGVEMQVGNKIVPELEYYLSYPQNKRLVEVKKKKFKKQIADWLKDNPDIASKYTEEEFDESKATAIIIEFNNWKAKQ